MNSSRPRTAPTHAWEHWGWVWTVVFCASIVLPLVEFVGEQRAAAAGWSTAAVLAGSALLLHFVAIWGMPRWNTHVCQHPLFGLTYVATLGAITFGLLLIHPIFYFVLLGFFSQLFYALPPRLAIGAALLTNVLLGFFTLNDRPFPAVLAEPVFWLWVLGGLCGSLISLWLNAIIDQSAQRQALIEDLRRTQSDLARAEREAGVLQERQRLAREIHDTLAQGLISIITHLEAADQALERNGPSLQHHLAQALRTARTNLGEARRVVQDLRPEILDQRALPDALHAVVQAWKESSGINAWSTVTGTVRPLDAETELTLLRVAQEALANVAKHADAHIANVTLSYLPDRVLLDVQDDGKGVQDGPADALVSAGFGLRSMRERVENLGGTLMIESEPGEGATLVVEVPTVSENALSANALVESEPVAPEQA